MTNKIWWSKDEEDLLISLRAKGMAAIQITEHFKKIGLPREYDSIQSKLRDLKVRKQHEAFSEGYVVNPSTTVTSGSTSSITVGTISFSSYEKPELPKNPQKSNGKKVLVIGDFHAPFGHPNYPDFLLKTYKEWECDTVVCIGDEADFHAISDYDPDPNGRSSGDELKEAINQLQSLYKAFPDVFCVTSNHTARPFKKAFKSGLPIECVKTYAEILKAPTGWTWQDKLEIDGVVYHHGESYSGALGHRKAAIDARKSCVIGHIHSHGGVAYIANEWETIFGMNVGCGIDVKAYAFAYGSKCASKPTLGCGVVLEGKEAYFIPMK